MVLSGPVWCFLNEMLKIPNKSFLLYLAPHPATIPHPPLIYYCNITKNGTYYMHIWTMSQYNHHNTNILQCLLNLIINDKIIIIEA